MISERCEESEEDTLEHEDGVAHHGRLLGREGRKAMGDEHRMGPYEL